MSITDLNQFLSRESVYLSFCCYEKVQLAFDVTPHEYLEFMDEDLKGNEKRNLINALSNAKRALDCQIESLLYVFCLKSYTDSRKMRIPDKIELLNKMGIIAPRILRKVNKIRNTMEHEFSCPSINEAQDFADVVILFIGYTDKYLLEAKRECEIMDNTDDSYCYPKFDRDGQIIIVDVRHSDKDKEDETIVLKANNETIDSFLYFVSLYIKICTYIEC